MTKATIEFVIWLAGFVDGEGSIGLCRERDKRKGPDYWGYRPTLQITNTSDVLWEIHYVLACGHISKSKRKGNQQDCWHFTLANGKYLVQVLTKLIPYLKVKREQAISLVSYINHRRLIRGCGHYKPHDDVTQRTFKHLKNLNLRGTEARKWKQKRLMSVQGK